MAIKLAASISYLFKERPLLERFSAAAKAGFQAVELGAEIPDEWSKEELVAAKVEAGVKVINLCTTKGSKPGDMGLAAKPGREKEFRAVLATAIEYAKALHCPRVHTPAGTVDSPAADGAMQKAQDTYIKNLRYAADECAMHNITVLVEPISTIPDFFLRHQQQAVDILKEVDRPNVKIEFDIYQAQILDGNLTMFVQNNLEYIGHIQVSQVPGRHEPDENGEINFPFFFEMLGSLGYDGWVGCEYNPVGTTEEGLSWMKQYI